jgi:lysylphosphatidylglycerol synthetase-like protein (DUF2156 family)
MAEVRDLPGRQAAPAGTRKTAGRLPLRKQIDALLERRRIEAPEQELSLEERWRHLRQHGDFSLAYSVVSEPYLKSFGDGRGFVAYAQKMGHTFAMGDPIASAQDAPGLIDDFIAAFGKPCFAACNEATSALLVQRGYRANHFGHDTAIDLPGHTFSGGEGKRIRYSTSWLKTNGMRVEERPLEHFPAERIRSISQRWRETRVVRREVRFLNREFSMNSEPETRRFFAVTGDGEPAAFVSFDPCYRDGRIIGYLASQKRRDPEGSTYVDLGIMRHAIDQFKAEGLEVAYLGLSPLASIRQGPFRDDPLLRRLSRYAYDSAWVNRNIFNVQGIDAYKKRFRGREIPLYIATPPGQNLFRIIGLLRLMRLI